MLSSNECSEVGEFAAESPELQGIYSNIYLHQTLMLFTFRINLLLKQSLGEIEVLGAWSLLAYKVHFCIADVSPLYAGAKFNCKRQLFFINQNSARQLGS